jgi:hypothetical protein
MNAVPEGSTAPWTEIVSGENLLLPSDVSGTWRRQSTVPCAHLLLAVS